MVKFLVLQQANMFITTCSNLHTAPQTFIYELSNQEKGVDSLTVTQLALMTGILDTLSTKLLGIKRLFDFIM